MQRNAARRNAWWRQQQGARRSAAPADHGVIDNLATALEARDEATAPLSITLENRANTLEVEGGPALPPPSPLHPPPSSHSILDYQ